ncbi:MAG: N-6 DNA methylase [Flavobacteriales bacterium]
MDSKKLLKSLGYQPKENTSGIFIKKYHGYSIEVDFNKSEFNFGKKIKSENKTTQNFSQAENWVVLECVDRLLQKGYNPNNIILEKTWKTGHGTSGRLDILVTRKDGSAYLMIECKTWGKEYEKELKNLHKNGGQLFTYFQQDKDADVIMLYASELNGKKIQFRNEIVKIEEDYRQTGNVKDLFERWNKQPKTNGVFDNWTTPYEFKSKALTKGDLKNLKEEDSSNIFNRFLEILRHNVVSDKPNAFNKIFTLFLCKIADEYSKDEDDELEFQWLEGQDDHISFQKRLTDLYNKGMKWFLEKEVTDVSDKELDKRFASIDEKYQEEFKNILTEIRLKKNNEFAIKEVYDDASFKENAKVVKEVVELLQNYRIRYNYRQQFLSDFFELLLTTGLKQESGQFFTPVPIARFIIKSLPFPEITNKKIKEGNKKDLLPTVIDYAAGSGHFITESMEEVQKYIEKLNLKKIKPETRKLINGFQQVPFDWAEDYIYGIEKDYRLVKTAKVGCYLHGDGLAKIIHGDGLGDFTSSTEFKGLLMETDKTYPQDNKQFDIIISNPPYSVSAFKGQMHEEKSKKAFDLYNRLTDQSSEIECLFIERTKQLLKDGGVAGIILPSSILSNTGIYTQTREIILKYFEVLAITEFGSNTFMATGTNTVTLFLKRRNNADAFNIEEAVKKLFTNLQDVTINGIENPLQKYITHVWEDISFDDYKTLLQELPNENIKNHEIYQEYDKKIKSKKEEDKWAEILEVEKEKLLYFILTLKQKVVLIKTGSKTKEKHFLGYEFSNRRGSEGIHPIQRSKTIDDCTQLYDATTFENPEKASTYIYNAFNGNVDLEINENLKENVSYQNLVDMLTFDRVDFEKNISLSVKKKVKIESKWESKRFDEIADIIRGVTYSKSDQSNRKTSKIILTADNITLKGSFEIKKEVFLYDDYQISDEKKLKKNDIFICFSSGSKQHLGKVAYIDSDTEYYAGGFMGIIRVKNNNESKYFFQLLNTLLRQSIRDIGSGSNINNLSGIINSIKIPLPPKDVQQKIVAEIEILEQQEEKATDRIIKLKEEIISKIELIQSQNHLNKRLGEIFDYNVKTSNPKKHPEDKFTYIDIQSVGKNTGKISYLQQILGKTAPSRARRLAKKGNFIISSVRPNLKGFAYLDKDVSKCIFSTGFFIVDSKDEQIVLNKYGFYMFMYSQNILSQMTSKMDKGQYPSVNSKDFDSIKIPLPPIKEQEKVVTEINKLEVEIETLEKQIVDAPNLKEKILKKYL